MATKTENVQLRLSAVMDGEAASQSLGGLKKEVAALNRELNKLVPGTEEFAAKLEELAAKKANLDEINASIRGVKNELSGIDKGMDAGAKGVFSLSGAMNFLKASILPLLALETAIQLFTASFDAFKESAAASAELSRALKGNTEDIEALTKQATELQNVTLFDDNQIQQSQAMLASMGATRDEIEQLTPLVLDYAQKMGTDAAGAAEVFGVALGATAGPLEDMGVKYEESASRAEKFAIIQSTLNNRIGGAAETAANAGGTAMQRFSNRINDLLESIGSLISDGLETLEPVLDLVFALLKGGVDTITFLVNGIKLTIDVFQNLGQKFVEFHRPLIDLMGGFEGISNTVTSVMNKIGEFADYVRDKLAMVGLLSENTAQAAASAAAKQAEQMAAAADEARVKEAQAQAEADKKAAEEAQKRAEEHAQKLAEQRKQAAEERKRQLEQEAKDEEAAQLQLRDAQIAAIQDDTERQKASLQARFDDQISKLRGSEATKAALTKEYKDALDVELAAIDAKKAAEKDAANLAALEKLQAQEAERLRLITEAQKGIEEAERASLELRLQQAADTEAAYQLQLQQDYINRLAAVGFNEEAMIAEKERYDAMKIESEQRLADATLAIVTDSEAAKVEEVKNAQKKVLDLAQAESEKKISLESKTTKNKADLASQQRKAASDALNFTIGLLEQEEGTRKEFAGAIKTLKAATITVNAIDEISAIWRNANSNSLNAIIPGFGQALAAVQTAATIARSGKAIADINSEQFAYGGLFDGPSHAQGGMAIISGGRKVAEMEGGEAIINRRSTAMYAPILSAINQAGGGVKFADGGMFNLPNIAPDAAAVANTTAQSRANESEMINTLRGILEATQRPTRAVVSLNTFEDTQAERDAARNEFNL